LLRIALYTPQRHPSRTVRPAATASVVLFPRALRLEGTRRLDRIGTPQRLDANVALRATMGCNRQ